VKRSEVATHTVGTPPCRLGRGTRDACAVRFIQHRAAAPLADARGLTILASMATAAIRVPVTYADFVAGESRSREKHQFVAGEVFSMAGASAMHAALTLAVGGLLLAQLRGKPCRAYSSDLRVRIAAARMATYPDVSVVCGALEFAPDDALAIVNPTLLVEVLSDSTEKFDRSRKFAAYRTLISLQEYLLVSQHEPLIERFVRNADQSWNLSTYGPGQQLQLTSINSELAVDDVYEGLVLEPSLLSELDARV
jgi:Uma2 family endonuclease